MKRNFTILIALVLAGTFLWRVTHAARPLLRIAFVPLRPLGGRQADPVKEFPELFPLQVALLWTNTKDGTETPLAVIHALKEMGIPFFVTRDVDQALRHHLVILYPGVDSQTFQDTQTQRLTQFVREGGNLFAQ